MSSLLVHGLKMPSEGDVMRVVKNVHGQLVIEYLSDQLMTSFHPLFEVKTPHGRCIDVDEFKGNVCQYGKQSTRTIGEALANTSTILPPETDFGVKTDKEVEDEITGLKPCPFCGGPAEMFVQNHIPKGYDYTPRCKNTGCPGRLLKKYTNRKKAILVWNSRT